MSEEHRGIDFALLPASDNGLRPAEQARSVRREPGGFSRLCHGGVWCGLRAGLGAVYRLEVTGREALPTRGPFVVVANHSSHLDALALTAALPLRLARSAYPLAAADFFFEGEAAPLVVTRLLNALPVQRGRGARHAIRDLRERLGETVDEGTGRRGSVFLLFPEGTRSADGTFAGFKPGLGMLVAGQPVPVVPAWIAGAHAAWPRDAKRPGKGRLRVSFGGPLHFEDLENKRAGWEAVAERAHAAVAALEGGSTPPAVSPA